MYVQSFIFSITSTVTMILFIYNTFFKRNINHYKIKSDNQRKFLHIYNINKFRNILFDYCNSLDLSELKYEIEKNDFQYINKLLQIKNQIDIYYHNNSIKYYNESDDTDDSDVSDVSHISYNKEMENIDNVTDNTGVNNIDITNTDIKNINTDSDNSDNSDNSDMDSDYVDNTELENIKKELTKLLKN